MRCFRCLIDRIISLPLLKFRWLQFEVRISRGDKWKELQANQGGQHTDAILRLENIHYYMMLDTNLHSIHLIFNNIKSRLTFNESQGSSEGVTWSHCIVE